MTEFITKDNKVIPINNSKNNLSSNQLGIGNESLTRKDEKVESLMSTKQGGFPPTTTKVGIQKGWREEDYLKARKIIFDIVEKETGHTLDENGVFRTTETLNGEEINSGFGVVPTQKNTGSSRYPSYIYTGFRVNLPKESLNKFDDRDKFENETEIEIKNDSRSYDYVSYITIPASNPSKINQLAPKLNDLVAQSLQRQAEGKLKAKEEKEMKARRKVTIKSIHETLIGDLKREGFTNLERESYESSNSQRQTVRTQIEVTKDSITKLLAEGGRANRTFVNVTSQIEDSDGEVTFAINDQFRLKESQVIKVLRIMKEE